MRKKKLTAIAALALALFALAASVGVLIAWFVNYQYLGSTQYQILQINSTINMYKGLDKQGNYNAAPDTLAMYEKSEDYYLDKPVANSDNETWSAYSKTAYEIKSSDYKAETYAFQLLDNVIMLSTTNTASTFNEVSITDMAPSRIFTYKFEITNYAPSAATLTCAFNEASDLTYLQYLQVRMYQVEKGTFTLLNTETSTGTSTGTSSETSSDGWLDFYTSTTDDSGTETKTAAEVTVASGISLAELSSKDANSKVCLWLQIRMKPSATTEIPDKVSLPTFVTTLTVNTESTSA